MFFFVNKKILIFFENVIKVIIVLDVMFEGEFVFYLFK